MPKKIISATIDETLIKWLETELKNSKEFRNKSHLIEVALESFQTQRKEVKHGRGPKG
jgi:hypothetical protein